MNYLRTFESFSQSEIEDLRETTKEIFSELDLEFKCEIKYNFEINIQNKRKKYLHSNIQISIIDSLKSEERIKLIKTIIECLERHELMCSHETNLREISVIGGHIDTYHTKEEFLNGMGKKINFTGGNRNKIDIISIHLTTFIKNKWMPPFIKSR